VSDWNKSEFGNTFPHCFFRSCHWLILSFLLPLGGAGSLYMVSKPVSKVRLSFGCLEYCFFCSPVTPLLAFMILFFIPLPIHLRVLNCMCHPSPVSQPVFWKGSGELVVGFVTRWVFVTFPLFLHSPWSLSFPPSGEIGFFSILFILWSSINSWAVWEFSDHQISKSLFQPSRKSRA